jgi:hypothetical protein
MYFIPPGDGRSITKEWKTKKSPSKTLEDPQRDVHPGGATPR